MFNFPETIERALLEEIVPRLVAEFGPKQIYLLGSHTWGIPEEWSDLDLMVVVVSESDLAPARRAA